VVQYSTGVLKFDPAGRPYFDYTLGSRALAGLAPNTIELEAGQWTSLTLGGAEEGSCSVSKVKSLPGEFSGTGLYFSEARFGFFFCPTLGIESLHFHDVDPQDFVRLISEKLSVPVGGLITWNSQFQFLQYPPKAS